jgi:tetratricopeptide (TPR) repeat protein
MRCLLAGLLLFTAQPALAANWKEAETTHFRIISSGDEAALRKFAERLEHFHGLLRLATGINESGRPLVKVRVYLVANTGDVKRLHGDPNSSVAGFYSPRDDGAIAVVPRTTGSGDFTGEVVLFHEYAHHYMLQYTPAAYPSWYVEGFAEIASTASFERKGAITFGKAAQHRQYELDGGMSYPVPGLLDGSYLTDQKKGRGWSYGDAWLLSHYLTFTDTRRGQLREYLNAVNAGKPLAEAAKVFGDLGELQREVSRYLAGRNFPYRAVPIDEAKAGPITLRALGAAQAELVEFTIEFERRMSLPSKDDQNEDEKAKDKSKTKEDFEQRLARMKREREEWMARLELIANKYASDPAGWLLLADARCTAGQFEACAAAAERALALAPTSQRGMVRKAHALIGLAKDLPEDKRKASVELARSILIKANAADPSDPLAFQFYYRSYAALGRGTDEEGLLALATVVELVPQEPGSRLVLAQEYMQRGRWAQARRILRPLAYSPHQTGAAKFARKLLDQVEGKLGGV